MLEKLFGPYAELAEFQPNVNGERLYLFKVNGYDYDRYFAVMLNEEQQPKTSRLVTTQWDMELGGCGSIGDLNGDGLVDIEFTVGEVDCSTKRSRIRRFPFIYSRGVFRSATRQ